MGEQVNLSRRRFLTAGAAAGGGLLIGFHIPGFDRWARAVAPEQAFVPNAWIRVASDGQITVMVASSEMGQGVMTAIPMLAAEELDADWDNVRAEFAPEDPAYTNPIIGQQLTGGSTAVRGFWNTVRRAGATARAMLVQAAAERWGVDPLQCRTRDSQVIHAASGRRLGYRDVAERAAQLEVPETVFLKEPDEFRLLGTSRARLDTPDKCNGSARFGQDVSAPGMLIAQVERCPVFGGKVKSFEAAAAKDVKGVRHVFAISSGVAVVADTFWAAHKGRKALQVTWEEGEHAQLSSPAITEQFKQAVDKGKNVRQEGDAAGALEGASKTLEAVYEVPYLAHACMEPMNCSAHVRADGCDVWVPTQAQTRTRRTVERVTGLAAEKIHVHTTFLGGGFGRRSEQDFVTDAVEISKRTGTPVKVMWTREDDIRHDYYRPATYNRLRGGIGRDGTPVAWVHNIAGPSIRARFSPEAAERGLDDTSTEGAANLPYAIPNIQVTYAMVNPGVPVGFWRSVGSSQNAFITECFLDELAAAAGEDPYQLRRRMLTEHPRHKKVLEVAAEKAGWGRPLPEGRYRGIAVAESFGSYVAEVAEVSVDDGNVRVHRVVCAIDCGQIVNPDTITAQMESGIVYGLTAALKGEITLDNGRVQQGNFDDYPALRINEMPEVEVHIVRSGHSPGGVGEPGTPPIAPAVANAVFAATGRPVRRLPIRLS